MATVHLERDEWWPVFIITEKNYGEDVEMPDELRDRLRASMKEFAAVQNEVSKLWDEQHGRP